MKPNSLPTIAPWIKSAVVIGLLVASLQTANAQEPTRQLVQNATTAKRIALVIGNGAYTSAPPLKNPPNDARDMAATLRALGFDVTNGINVNQRDMKRLIREFGQKLKGGGSGLFYYAGHGVQSKARNYLIPVDANIQSEAEVEDSGVDAALVLNFMDDAQNGLNIVILDACRNNPFARSFRSASDGLAQVDAPTGTLIAYATAPGRVASDGPGQNGLYTSELLKQMQAPGVSITDMFMRVRAEVMKQTGNKQVPWEASSLVGSFYFSGAPGESSSTKPGGSGIDASVFELSYWETIKNSQSADDFKAYLEKYPEGQFAKLARNRITSVEPVTKPAEPSTPARGGQAELTFWDSIKNSTSAEDYRAYLERYPNGEFATLAKNRLARLEAAEIEKAKEEEAKRIKAEEEKPLRSFQVTYKAKITLVSESWPAELLFFQKSFDIIGKYSYRNEKCEEYRGSKVDGLEIREITGSQGVQGTERVYIRLRFRSAAEANEAWAEIQRICKANP